MERELTSFDIYVLTLELQEIIGSYIDKIYQLSRNEILIKIRNSKTREKESIYVRNGELICLTKKDFKTPQKPTTFAMALRKYLQNGRIVEISQHEFDRILNIKISKKEGNYTLVIELFSNGNIILVDPDSNIILPLIRQVWAHRNIKGREPYVSPPEQINPFSLTLEKFTELIHKSNADVVRTLAVNINLSGQIAEEICIRSSINKNTKIKEFDQKKILLLFNELKKFLNLFESKKFKPMFVKRNNKIVDILPFEFKSYKGYVFEKIDKFSRGLEEFIEVEEDVEQKNEVESENDKIFGKLNRQLLQQKESIQKLKQEIQEKKKIGDLIYLNYQECNKVLDDIKKILELKDKDVEIKKINESKSVKIFSPEDNLLIMMLKDIDGSVREVKLDFRKTVSENAEKAYQDSKKLSSKLHGAERSIEKTLRQIDRLKDEIEVETKKNQIKPEKISEKTFWFEKYRWFISSDGNIVIAGRDAKSNDIIVKRYLKPGDRYVHADIHGAPSVIVKCKDIAGNNIPISRDTLKEACVFASSYSKAWKQFAEAQAYWVNPEQVSKTPQSGEFIPRGAFVIRGKRNYCKCKLEIAVGLVKIDRIYKVMGGPITAVKNLSHRYVILSPGDEKKTTISHKLSKIFNVSSDRIYKVLPPGDVSVIDTVGFKFSEG